MGLKNKFDKAQANVIQADVTKANVPDKKPTLLERFDSNQFAISNNLKGGFVNNGGINPVGNTGLGQSQYDYNIPEALVSDNLEPIRASRQPWTHQLTNAVLGGAASGVVGALEGFSAIGDQLVNIGNSAEEWERGALSQVLYDLKKDINDLTPLYRKDRDDVFDWNDKGFYFEVLKGAVDSAVAFGLPGAGYGMAVGKLGSLLGKATLAGRRLDVLTRAGGRAVGLANPSQKIGAATAAFLSNYNEGTVMGMQTYDEQKELLMKDLTQKMVNDKMKAGDETPLSAQELKDIEYKASIEAGKAAEYVRDFNHFMIASNYLSVRSLFNPVNSAARNMVKKPSFKNWVKDQMIGAPMEGAEEIAQGVLQNEVSFRNKRNFYQENGIDTGIQGFEEYNELADMSMSERLIDFATRDETLLEGMMGLVSGPIQYAVTGLPGQSARNKALTDQYNKQLGIIEQNKRYITNKLAFEETTEDLKQSFEDFSKNVLNKGEMDQEDMVEFQSLIDNTSFDTLVVQNFFGGTTENLEKELQSVLEDENADDTKKQNAEKYLGRLQELENRYNKFQMYQDGAHMFATQLRSERLQELSGILSKAYQQNEADLTKLINDRINSNSTKVKGKRLAMEDLLFFEEEQTVLDENGKEKKETVQVPIRSVGQAIDGVLGGKSIKSKDGRVFNQTAFKSGKAFDVAAQNRQGLRHIDEVLGFYNRIMDETKSSEYENEFANYQDALNTPVTKDKIKALKEFKKEFYNKYPKKETDEKYLNLKARLNQNINTHEQALKEAELLKQQQDEEAKEAKSDTALKAKAERVARKTNTPQPPSSDPSSPSSPSSPVDPLDPIDPKPDLDPSMNPDLEFRPTGKPLFDEDGNFSDEGEGSFDGEATQSDIVAQKAAEAMAKKSSTPDPKKATTTESKEVQQTTSEGDRIVKVKDTNRKNETSERNYVVDKDGKVYFHKPSAKGQKGQEVKSKTLADKVRLKIKLLDDKGKVKVKHKATEKSKEKDYIVDSENNVYEVSPNGNVTTLRSGGQKPAILEKAEKLRESKKEAGTESKKTKTDTTKPVHILSDEDKEASIDNYEPLPNLTEDDSDIAKGNIKLVANSHDNKLDKTTKTKADPTVAKLMSVGGTAEFQSKVLRNFKNKTGVEANVEVTSVLPEGLDGRAANLANKAIEIYNNVKKSGKYTDAQLDFLVKYLPVKVDFGKGAYTYLYPMNFNYDPNQNKGTKGIPQHEGEKAIRTRAIIDSIKGNKTTVKVKGQQPGAINFTSEEKPLSEIQLFENPMNAKVFVSINGYLQNVDKGNPYNPFSDVFMQYDVGGNPQPWLGIFVVEAPALNGMKFPLKVNTRGHDDVSAEILFDLYDAMISSSKDKNLMKVAIKEQDPALFERIKQALPGIINTYGEAVDYTTVINDMVFEGAKTRGRNTALFFEKGKVYFGDKSYTPSQFKKNKKAFIDFIKDFKTFNVTASRLNNPKYRAHVFQNYLSTNADIDDMFTAEGVLNPEGDSFKRMQSGAMYIDVTSAKTTSSDSKATATTTPDQKAEIERRRGEELDSRKIEETLNYIKNNSLKVGKDYIEGGDKFKLQSLFNSVGFDTEIHRGRFRYYLSDLMTGKGPDRYGSQIGKDTYDIVFNENSNYPVDFLIERIQYLKDKINAKYDAELAALEGTTTSSELQSEIDKKPNQLELFDPNDIVNDKPRLDKQDPLEFDESSEDELKTQPENKEKDRMKKEQKAKEEAKKKAEETDLCKLKGADAIKKARDRFGDDDFTI